MLHSLANTEMLRGLGGAFFYAHQVKIADLGLARPLRDVSADPTMSTYIATRWYRPPEVCMLGEYSKPVDAWALGCIYAELLLGRPLFAGRDEVDQLHRIMAVLGKPPDAFIAAI